MATQVKSESKLALLAFIKEKKDVLFGKFTSELDKNRKTSAWKDALIKAQSLQIVASTRDWTYLRDNVFGVWKTRAMAKKDNRKKTGSEGGKDRKLTEVDNAVLDIVGRDSPVMEGLPIGETGNFVPTEIYDSQISNPDIAADQLELSTPAAQLSRKSRQLKRKSDTAKQILVAQKEAKLELMKLQIYKTKLEALKLERELNLPRSGFTKEFEPPYIVEIELDRFTPV